MQGQLIHRPSSPAVGSRRQFTRPICPLVHGRNLSVLPQKKSRALSGEASSRASAGRTCTSPDRQLRSIPITTGDLLARHGTPNPPPNHHPRPPVGLPLPQKRPASVSSSPWPFFTVVTPRRARMAPCLTGQRLAQRGTQCGPTQRTVFNRNCRESAAVAGLGGVFARAWLANVTGGAYSTCFELRKYCFWSDKSLSFHDRVTCI